MPAQVPFHTHTFSIPVASAAEITEGEDGSKVVVPSELAPVLAAVNAAANTAAANAQAAADAASAAALAAQANLNKGQSLLGSELGIGLDAEANDAATIGGAVPATGTFLALTTFDRDNVEYKLTADGLLTQVAADAEIFPSRVPADGTPIGIYIGEHRQPLIYYSDDLNESDWDHLNGLTVAVDVSIVDPAGGSGAWKLTDTNNAAFGILERGLDGVTISNDEYLTFYVWAKAGTSSRFQFKPRVFGGTTFIFNVTFDLETGSIVQAVNATGEMIPYPNGWYLCIVNAQNTATGNTGIIWSLIPDIADVANTGYLWVFDPNVLRGRRWTGYRAPDDQPLKPTLTGTKWNTIAGSTTIGDFGAGNLANLAFTHADWDKSNVTVPAAHAGEGVGGNDAYTLDDTSSAANAFVQQTFLASATASQWATFSFFLHTNHCTGQKLQIKSNFFANGGGSTPVQPVFTIDYVAKTWEVAGGTGFADIVPVDANTLLIVTWFQNSADVLNVDFRANIYPGGDDIASVTDIRVSRPLVKISAAALWTADALSALEGDRLSFALANTAFTSLSGTVAVDFGNIPAMEPGSSLAVTLFSIDLGTANSRILLRLQTGTTEDDFVLVGQFINVAGVSEITLTSSNVELAAARWWLTWDSTGAAMGRDEIQLAVTSDASVRPTGMTTLNIGQTYAGTGQPCASFVKGFYRPVRMNASSIYAAGNYNFTATALVTNGFTATEEAAQDSETLVARNTLLARERTGNFMIVSSLKTKITFSSSLSQSFARTASTSLPPYTDYNWLVGKPWATAQMLGGSVRPLDNTLATFELVTDMDGIPGGVIGLNSLVATGDNNGAVLSAAQLAAGYTTWSSSNSGESPVVALGHEFTRLNNVRQGITGANTTNIVIAGVAGSSTDAYLKDVAGDDDASDSDVWLQSVNWHVKVSVYSPVGTTGWAVNYIAHGESMYSDNATKEDYLYGKAYAGNAEAGIGMIEALDNIKALALSHYTQAEGPLNVVNVPALKWIKDGIEIGKAWDWLEENRDDVVIATCSIQGQPGASNNEHLSALGSKTLGLHAARAVYNISVLGQNYFIPKPYKLWQADKTLRLGVLAMDYPLLFKEWFGTYNPQIGIDPDPDFPPNYGFRIKLGSQVFSLAAAPTISASGCCVDFLLNSKPSGFVTMTYAGRTASAGHGNLFDSGADFTSDWDHVFKATDNPAREVAEFAGERISGNRACRPFEIVAQAWGS